MLIEQSSARVSGAALGSGRLFWHGSLGLWALLPGAILFFLSAWYHYTLYLPQPDRPHRLTLLDDVFALGVALLMVLVGLVLGRRILCHFELDDFSPLERGALAIGVGWGLLSLGVLALGLAHLLYLWALFAGMSLVLLIGWRDVWQVAAKLCKRELYRSFGKMRPGGFWEWSLGALALLEMLLVGVQALTLPYVPLGYDLYQYHWAVPELYLLHHQVYVFPGWAHADFPIQNDLLSVPALAVQEPVAALMIQMTFGLLSLALLAGVLYRYVGRQGALLGIALYLASPLLTGVLGIGYAESALAYYAVASLVIVLARLRQQLSDKPVPWRLLVLGGIFGGMGLATKYTQGAVIVGVGVLILGTGILKMVGRVHRQQYFWPVVREMALGVAAYAGGVFLPIAPWLIKDWVLLGNPIYPLLWGGPGWDAARSQMSAVTFGHFGPQGPLWLRLLSAFFSLFFDTSHVGEPFLMPPNYALLIVLLVPAFWPLARWNQQKSQAAEQSQIALRWAWPWLLVGGCGYVLWVLSQALVGRYAIAWMVLLIVPAALALLHAHRLLKRWPLLRGTLRGFVLFLLLLGPLWTLQYWVGNNPFSLLTGAQSLRQWEAQHIMEPDYWSMVDYVNSQLPRDAKVLLVGQAAGYFLQGRDYVDDSGDDWIPYLETEGHTQAGMLRLLQQDGFQYLIYGERTLQYIIHTYGNAYLGSFLPAFRQFLADSLNEVWSYKNFHIYKIPVGLSIRLIQPGED